MSRSQTEIINIFLTHHESSAINKYNFMCEVCENIIIFGSENSFDEVIDTFTISGIEIDFNEAKTKLDFILSIREKAVIYCSADGNNVLTFGFDKKGFDKN